MNMSSTVELGIVEALAEVVGRGAVSTGDAIHDDYAHDEALTATPRNGRSRSCARRRPPRWRAILALAAAAGVPVTARGTGTGLSGACIPTEGGIVVSFERMNAILEIDTENHVAVVQPGVTLEQLDEATARARPRLPRVPGRELAPASAATSRPTPAACAR